MLSLRRRTQGDRDRFSTPFFYSFSSFSFLSSFSLFSFYSPSPSIILLLLQVLCWASNSVGEQVLPCVFHVHPLGAARLPQQCQVTARSQGSLGVACRSRAKGLDTTWVLEVKGASLHLHLFLLLHLPPGVQYGEREPVASVQ